MKFKALKMKHVPHSNVLNFTNIRLKCLSLLLGLLLLRAMREHIFLMVSRSWRRLFFAASFEKC